MALPTASDNAFTSLLVTEQGSAPSSPAAGKRRIYVLSSDHLAYLKDSSGVVVKLLSDKGSVENYVDLAEQGSNPASPASGYERIFSKSDGVYSKTPGGTVSGPFGSAAPAFSGCRVTHNTTQNVTSGGDLTVAFNSEGTGCYDTDAYHDTSTANSRLTVPSGKAGKFHIFGQIEFSSNATGFRQLYLMVNNASIITIVQLPTISGDTPRYEINGYYDLAVGDYVELHVGQNSGSTLTVNAGSNFSPIFGMHLLH